MEVLNIFDVFNNTLLLDRGKPKNERICYEKYKGVAKNACILKSQYQLNKVMALKIKNLMPQAKGFRFLSTNRKFSGQAVGYALKSLHVPIRTEKEVFKVDRTPFATIDHLIDRLQSSVLAYDEINVYSNFNGLKNRAIDELNTKLNKLSIPVKTKINIYYVTSDDIVEIENWRSDIDDLVYEMTEKVLKEYL